VIGLVFLFVRMMVWGGRATFGLMVAMFALGFWLFLAMFLLFPGDKRGVKRSMNSASRSASRALRHAL
jgi:hypothetical protein